MLISAFLMAVSKDKKEYLLYVGIINLGDFILVSLAGIL